MTASTSTLKLVQVFFRHGDRTPRDNFEHYPNDPNPVDGYQLGSRIITTNGKRRARKLGQVLLETYHEFLGQITTKVIEGRTTHHQRTRESLRNVLAILAPGINVKVVEKPLIEDLEFLPQHLVNYADEYKEIVQLTEVKEKMERYKDFMERLSEFTGKTITSARDMLGIYMLFEIQHCFGFTLPDWAYNMYPDGELKEPASFEYEIMNYTDLMKKLNGGSLLKMVIDNIQGTNDDMPELDIGTNGTIYEERKMLLFSLYDNNIAALLIAMGVFYPHVPRFTSAVIFELHLIRGSYHVKILYYLGEPTEIVELQLPGCEILCPFEQFYKHVEPFLPNEHVDRTLRPVFSSRMFCLA